MRSAGDKREDSIVKSELFDAHVRDKYNVQFVLDDRGSCREDVAKYGSDSVSGRGRRFLIEEN